MSYIQPGLEMQYRCPIRFTKRSPIRAVSPIHWWTRTVPGKWKMLSKYLINDKSKWINESRPEWVSMDSLLDTFYCEVCLINVIMNLSRGTWHSIPFHSTSISTPGLPHPCFVVRLITVSFLYSFHVSTSCIRYHATYRATENVL